MEPSHAKQISGGLLPLPYDGRDLALGALFKMVPAESVPLTDFQVPATIFIKDQGESDMCTAYTVTAVSEDQEGIALSPKWQFAIIKALSGNIEEWGADLRTACKSVVKYGSIPQHYISVKEEEMDRNSIANIRNWDRMYENQAMNFKKESFLSVDGPNLFDAIRSALWTNRLERRSIAVGAKWRPEWTEAKFGVIPSVYGDDGFGHAFKIYGQKMINHKPYLMAQLSNGTDIGNYGTFYFPEEVVNREFVYGAFMFKDISVADAKDYIEIGAKVDDLWIVKLFKRMFAIIKI